MKSLVLVSARKLSFRETPIPAPMHGNALVKVDVMGICGADISYWKSPGDISCLPAVPGHEFSGVIVEMAGERESFRVGDRVTADPIITCGACPNCLAGNTQLCDTLRLMGRNGCSGVFAEYLSLPVRILHHLPSQVGDGNSVLAEPLSVAIHLMSQIPRSIPSDTKMAIYGAGLQGYFCLVLARINGWRDIAMVDINEHRLRNVTEFGVSLIINSLRENPVQRIREWTENRGVEIGIDASRAGSARRQLRQSMAKGGMMILLGLSDLIDETDFGSVIYGELQVRGSYAYRAEDFETAIAYLSDRRIDLNSYVRRMPFEETQIAFENATQLEQGHLKTVLYT